MDLYMRGKTLNFGNRSPQFSRLYLQFFFSFVWYLINQNLSISGDSRASFWEIAAWFRCDQPSAKRRLASFADQNKKKRYIYFIIKTFLNEGRFLTLCVLVSMSKMLITGLQYDGDLGRPRISSSEVVPRWPPSDGLRSAENPEVFGGSLSFDYKYV